MQIEDGKGSGLSAEVDNGNRLRTSTKNSNRAAVVSSEAQRAFNAVFSDASAAAGDYSGYIKNTASTRNLFVDVVRFGQVNAALWKTWVVTGTGTGTAVTAVNLNLGSGLTPEATILADAISGLTTAGEIARIRGPAATPATIEFDDVLVLAPNTAIAFEYDTGTTGIAEITVRFYFEDL